MSCMTLQYSPRSMWEDRKWWQRVRLCKCLLIETADWWCRSDEEFPISDTVTAVLYLFSPRADPLSISESNLRSFLTTVVQDAGDEYALAWPSRAENLCTPLIDAISKIIGDAERAWTSGSMVDPSIEMVNQQVVDTVVEQKYVVFHHNQTTRRDGGGFHSQG